VSECLFKMTPSLKWKIVRAGIGPIVRQCSTTRPLFECNLHLPITAHRFLSTFL
jgi:hypothetical protein